MRRRLPVVSGKARLTAGFAGLRAFGQGTLGLAVATEPYRKPGLDCRYVNKREFAAD